MLVSEFREDTLGASVFESVSAPHRLLLFDQLVFSLDTRDGWHPGDGDSMNEEPDNVVFVNEPEACRLAAPKAVLTSAEAEAEVCRPSPGPPCSHLADEAELASSTFGLSPRAPCSCLADKPASTSCQLSPSDPCSHLVDETLPPSTLRSVALTEPLLRLVSAPLPPRPLLPAARRRRDGRWSQ